MSDDEKLEVVKKAITDYHDLLLEDV